LNGITVSDYSNITVANNIIYSNVNNGIDVYYAGDTYVTVVNNIIGANGKYGIYRFGAGLVYNSFNTIYANGTANYYNLSAGLGDIFQDPSFIDTSVGNFVLMATSTSKNVGRPGAADADPDNSRNDMGAYGGPDAAGFWPYPQGGPIITNLTLEPTAIQKGGTVTIKATGSVQ
jgi:hypothetical protein